jgi:CYTH domain-containing protein
MHHEYTIPLNIQEYEAIKSSSNKTVQKDRYEVSINGYRAEVDVFKGLLKGLVLIDFEFNSVEERDAFVVPPVCLVEVTQEEFIAGGLLGGKSYEEIEPKLAAFNYKPII